MDLDAATLLLVWQCAGASGSMQWTRCPPPWPSQPFHPCPLPWALGNLGNCQLQWYQDTLTQLPCYLQLFHGPMKFSQPLPPHLNVPQGAAAVLMVCASGESTQHSYRPCGKWCSQDTHSNPTWPQTCFSCGPTANKPELFAHFRRPGPPQCTLESCGWGLHFQGSLSLPTAVLTQPCWEAGFG